MYPPPRLVTEVITTTFSILPLKCRADAGPRGCSQAVILGSGGSLIWSGLAAGLGGGHPLQAPGGCTALAPPGPMLVAHRLQRAHWLSWGGGVPSPQSTFLCSRLDAWHIPSLLRGLDSGLSEPWLPLLSGGADHSLALVAWSVLELRWPGAGSTGRGGTARVRTGRVCLETLWPHRWTAGGLWGQDVVARV